MRTALIALVLVPACTTVPTDTTNPIGSNTSSTTGNTSGSVTGTPGGVSPSIPATLLEQLSLERVNRARLRPANEAASNGIAIDEGAPGQLDTTPKQPLALNAILTQTARRHSQDMLNRDYFQHDSPDGQSPFDRMTAAGFSFITAGENLAWRGTTGTINEVDFVENEHVDLFVDTGIPGRGHRLSMLNGDFREVGIGILRGSFTNNGSTYDSMMQTQDFGTEPNSGVFVLGVVYNDNNNNGRYDFGEGIANSNVQLGQAVKSTNAGGGYFFEVLAADNYVLRFLTTNTSTTLSIPANAPNIKVDLVNGTHLVVNLGLGQL